MPASALKIVQISSAEGTWGTTGAATKKLAGIIDASLKVNSKVEVPLTLGSLGPGRIASEVARSGEGKVEGVASYEDMPSILNGFITAIGASTITSGAPYTYPYTAPVASTQAIATYTMEFGTTGATYKAPGSLFSRLSLSGEAGDIWKYSVDSLAKQITPASTGPTGSLSERSVNPIRMADTACYIDAFSTATIGTTITSGTLISFALDVDTKRHVKHFAGALAPADWGEGKWDGTLKLVLELNSSAKALLDESVGATGALLQRQIRIYATEGSSASVRSATIDFAGAKIDGETLFSDREGNVTIETTWQGVYSTGLENWLKFSVQNGSSSTT